VINFGAHPTILPSSNFLVSAEWPGRLVASIDEATNNSIQAVFFQDAAGDISPTSDVFNNLLKKIREKHGSLKGLKSSFSPRLQEKSITYYGKTIGKYSLALARSIKDDQYFDHAEMICYTRSVWFPMKDFKQKYNGFIRCQNRVVHIVKKYVFYPLLFCLTDGKEINFPVFALKHRGIIDVNYYTKLQYFRVNASDSTTGKTGSFNIIGMPSEPFRHLARSVQRKSKEGVADSFLFQMANDWIAYLFDFAEYTRGGTAPFEGFDPVAGEYIKKYFLQLFDDIDAGLTAGHN
jgi:hypothetical protein